MEIKRPLFRKFESVLQEHSLLFPLYLWSKVVEMLKEGGKGIQEAKQLFQVRVRAGRHKVQKRRLVQKENVSEGPSVQRLK